MCGSSFLNEEFQAYIVRLIKKHRVVGKKDEAWQQRKAAEITWTHFEFGLKRHLNIYDDNLKTFSIRTNGLPDDHAHGFGNDYVIVP